jgi:phage shock protein PspC (stress-responsive transcriptional regulator)
MNREEMFKDNSTKMVIAHTVAITVVGVIAGLAARTGAEMGYLKGLSMFRNHRNKNVA